MPITETISKLAWDPFRSVVPKTFRLETLVISTYFYVRMSSIDKPFINLIADAQSVVLDAKVSNDLQLLSGIHLHT